MNYRNALFLVLLFLHFSTEAQYTFSSHNAHVSIEKAINISKSIIKSRTEYFEKKAEKKPLLFLREKKDISRLNHASNSVSKYIEKLQLQVNTESVLYNLAEKDSFRKILFTNYGGLTLKGKILKRKLDSLHYINTQINIRGFSQLKQFSEEHFKTQTDYVNESGKKVDYFNHFFYDKSNYGILMTLNLLLLDVKTNQLLFFGTIMSY